MGVTTPSFNLGGTCSLSKEEVHNMDRGKDTEAAHRFSSMAETASGPATDFSSSCKIAFGTPCSETSSICHSRRGPARGDDAPGGDDEHSQDVDVGSRAPPPSLLSSLVEGALPACCPGGCPHNTEKTEPQHQHFFSCDAPLAVTPLVFVVLLLVTLQ